MSENPEKRVRDVMIPVRNYKTISHTCKVEDAVKLYINFFARKAGQAHRSLIVCDDYGNPLGMVTVRSILQALEPLFARAQNFSVPLFWEGLFTERCRVVSQKSVTEVMYPINFIALDVNDTLIKAVHAMMKHKLGTLPVKKDNTLVGVIRVNEVFSELYNIVAGNDFYESAVTV